MRDEYLLNFGIVIVDIVGMAEVEDDFGGAGVRVEVGVGGGVDDGVVIVEIVGIAEVEDDFCGVDFGGSLDVSPSPSSRADKDKWQVTVVRLRALLGD